MANTSPADHVTMEHVLSWPTILPRVFNFILADKTGSWHSCPLFKNVTSGYRDASSDSEVEKDPVFNGDDHHCDNCTSYGWRGVLFRCALVNTHWFHEVIPFLWKNQGEWSQSGFHNTTLTDHMARLASLDRRQFYANIVEAATEWTTATPCDEVFEGVRFPKLRFLRMKLDYEHVARIDGVSVETLVLEPDYEESEFKRCCYSQEKMSVILEQIVKVFPNVREVKFTDWAVAYPGVLERFRKRMKRLETFEHWMIDEQSDFWE